MPLNKTKGESIPELGPHFVVPVQDYSREPSFHKAIEAAQEMFRLSGARDRVDFGPDDVVAQIHPNAQPHPKLVFWFRWRTRGGIIDKTQMDDERFFHYAYDILRPVHEAGHA